MTKGLHLENLKESEIVRLCAKGDERAQRAVYDLLSPKMYPVCLRYAGDRDSAMDILQDGFITLFGKIDSFRGDGSFEGWARRIFVTTALMNLRKRDIFRNAEELKSASGEVNFSPEIFDKLSAADLMKIIKSMPDGFRTVFNLYVIEGYSHQEIGEMLKISDSSSRSQLSRARTWLQNKLKAEG